MIEVGQIVKYREPAGNETGAERYIVKEVNDDRCFIEAICDWTIKPVELARTADLEVVASREAIAEFVEPAGAAIGRAIARSPRLRSRLTK